MWRFKFLRASYLSPLAAHSSVLVQPLTLSLNLFRLPTKANCHLAVDWCSQNTAWHARLTPRVISTHILEHPTLGVGMRWKAKIFPLSCVSLYLHISFNNPGITLIPGGGNIIFKMSLSKERTNRHCNSRSKIPFLTCINCCDLSCLGLLLSEPVCKLDIPSLQRQAWSQTCPFQVQ